VLEITIVTLLLVILAALLFWIVEWEITIGVGTLLLIVLTALLFGAVWVIFVIATTVNRRY
jgi:hypothetical protein